ncbi:MAG TPA: PQQ-binding-like beta-propeller repeat protein [Gemmatimonadaceae bacterium]|jgi:outer membrane protein assembly factor BamB
MAYASTARRVGQNILLAGGVVVCSTCQLLGLFSSDDAYRRNRLLWHTSANPVGAPAAYDGKRVFFVTHEHRVVALDGENGNLLWSAPADTAAVETVSVTLGGCTVGGIVVACADNGDLVAFRRTDGAFAWRFHASEGRSPGGNPFIVQDSSFYAGSRAGGVLYAIDVATGQLRWSARVSRLDTGIVRMPAADAELVVAPYARPGKPMTGGVLAVDAKTGTVLWDAQLPRILPDSDTSAGFVALDPRVVLVSSNSGRIFGIDRATGAILWNVPGVGRAPPSSPVPNHEILFDSRALVATGNRVYASSGSGWFTAIDLATHQEVWRSDPQLADSWSGPIYTDGKAVYVMYFKGCVAVFAADDGRLLSVGGKNELFVSIALGADRFFAPGDDGLYAFAK